MDGAPPHFWTRRSPWAYIAITLCAAALVFGGPELAGRWENFDLWLYLMLLWPIVLALVALVLLVGLLMVYLKRANPSLGKRP